MLPKELLDKVPTLNELLEHPRVREATQSWNESTLVARARGALMELGSEISRRSDSLSEVSPRDLFDRVLHLLDRPDAPPRFEVINATGRIGSDSGWNQVPLAEEVIAYATRHAGHFAHAEAPAAAIDRLKRLTKGESALVASSYVTAHEAFFGSLSKQAEQGVAIIVGRPDVGLIEPEERLLSLCESNQVKTIEVGAAQQATLEDYLEALKRTAEDNPNAKPWVYLGPVMIGQLADQSSNTALVDFVSAVHKQNAQLVMALADASPSDLPCEGQSRLGCSILTAAKAIEINADLVLLRGNGMVGGPAVGLLAGTQRWIDPIAQLLKERHWQASDWGSVLIDATLTLFEQPERLPFRLPIASLLDTPIDNLRTRAERLAQLIGASGSVGSAEPIELTGRQVGAGLRPTNSWGICLTPSAEGSLPALVELLRDSTPAVLGEIAALGEIRHEELILDLRTVLPSQDQQMVCAILGDSSD